MRWLFSSLCFIFWAQGGFAQNQEIELNNPSFEGIPHKGIPNGPGIRGWYDCGPLKFPTESPPDLHPINAWQVRKSPTDGISYLGMVVRDNDSWESISQRLSNPIEGGKCYSFDIQLARSAHYISASHITQQEANYTQPVVLRIWGGTGVCGHQELLGESITVSNEEWRSYEFVFRPTKTVTYFTLEVFYKTPTLFGYNGHLLLDNASTIKEIPCDEEDIPTTEAQEFVANAPSRPRVPEKTAPVPVTEALDEEEVQKKTLVEDTPKKPSKNLIPELEGNTFRKGQIIRVNTIYFEADSSKFLESSSDALDQLYQFMKRNNNVVIEIGGHTATTPPTKYCDNLSSRRAKEVATHIARMGISTKRLYYKGYGKRKPIYPNDKKLEARKKNQRVEIKILKTDYQESD